MIFTVDRMEGEYIVFISDDGEIRQERLADFGNVIREGDVFFLDHGTFIPCKSVEEARRKRVRAWMHKHKAKEQ